VIIIVHTARLYRCHVISIVLFSSVSVGWAFVFYGGLAVVSDLASKSVVVIVVLLVRASTNDQTRETSTTYKLLGYFDLCHARVILSFVFRWKLRRQRCRGRYHSLEFAIHGAMNVSGKVHGVTSTLHFLSD